MQISSLWSVKPEFRLKVSLLSLTFFFLTVTQALWRTLKAPIFCKIVGSDYIADAKIYSLFLMIPVIMLYSKLVDVLRRHQLVYVFTLFHGALALVLAYYLSRPDIGLANTTIDPSRKLGWIFYMFMESFSAFLSTTFWSFANSINKPKDAKSYYGYFVAGSKVGGMMGAGLLWLTLTISESTFFKNIHFSDTSTLTVTMVMGSLSLFCAALSIYFLMRLVPGYYMHGYEAVYKVEKKREKIAEHDGRTGVGVWLREALDGIRIIVTNPYVLGIFSLSLFYDMVISVFDLVVAASADATFATSGGMAQFYSKYFFSMHFVGLIISMGGTTPLQRMLGNRSSLLIFPILCMTLVGVSFFYPTAQMLLIILIVLRAANYGLNHPIREVLYIPTTKEIKFKCKAWSDAFGTRLAKGTSSLFYKHVTTVTPAFTQLLSTSFAFSVTIAWTIISYFLGRTLQQAIDKKQVIGEEGAGPAEKVVISK